jgi:methylenetetrahydrofolate dehydrogenase (NADP+)/methenyltetrahydrofolate cyclohydrolase
MSHSVLNGREIAETMLEQTRAHVADLTATGWAPKLCSISVGDVSAVQLYVRNQKRVADRATIQFEEMHFPAEIHQDQLLAAISGMNADPRVTGIILQRPVPAHLSIKQLQAAIHPLKDVEGMHPASIGNIVYNELELGPCTAMASVELLRQTGLNLAGLEVVVVGHSEIVGKPIAFLLMAEGATVTVCHHMTRNLSVHSRRADALFVAVGKPGLINAEMVKPGAAVIDIGINQVTLPDGSAKVVGDVDFASVSSIAGWITPVPGGVGPVTVAVLMRNAVIGATRQKRHYETLFGPAHQMGE